MPSIGNIRPSETMAVVSTIDPVTVVNVEAVGDYVDLGAWESVVFVFMLGNMAAETVDCKLEQASSSGGTGKKDLVTATQLAAHATNNDGTQVILEVRAEELDLTNSFRYVRPRMITGGASGGPCACIGLGFNARYGVGTDLTTVQEIKQA